MKYLILLLGLFVTTALHAQFGLYVEGGGNYSSLRDTRSQGIVNGKSGIGWQVGFGTEYHTGFGYFLYLGLDLASQNFKKDSSSADGHVTSNYNYKPLFLNFPFGIGYQFDVTKDVGLRVYGGINTQVGIGGNVTRNSYYILDSSGTRSSYNKHKIHYGRSIQVTNEFQSDLNNTIWGLTVGAGLNFSKSVEVTVFYQEGLNNILPGGDAAPEINKLRMVSVDLKLYFPKNFYSSKIKR
ncbi:MAG: PorT family protein [Parafilimonas sp.]|nr:PorT family protein [Parafilimonas sp.]